MRPSDTIPGFTPRARRASHARPSQGTRLLRRQVLAHPQPQRTRGRRNLRLRYPLRYGPVILGSATLFFSGILSLPIGWGSSTPLRAVVTLLLAVAGMASLIVAGMRIEAPRAWRRRALRRRGAFIGLGVVMAIFTLLVIAGGGRMTFGHSLSRSYWSDVISFSYVDAKLVLQGHNPYTSDPAFFPTLERFPYAIETPLRHGAFGQGFDYPSMGMLNDVERRFLATPSQRHGEFDPATLHSYPALSFLIYVPLIWIGWDNILLLNVAAFAGMFAWQVWLAPQGERHWGALAAGSVAALALYSLFLDNEVICLAFLLLAWHYRKNRWASGMLLGLGCAFKQFCWFFAPFFLLDALLSTPGLVESATRGATNLREHALLLLTLARRANWSEAAWRAGILLAAFLVPNLPFIIANPSAWWHSLWLPQSAPLFPMGMGVIALFTGHLLPYISPKFFTLLELLALCAALVAAARWRDKLGDGLILLALIPLLFAFRSLPNYFSIAPWIALYAANTAYHAYSKVAAARAAHSELAQNGVRHGRPRRTTRPGLVI